MSQPEPVEPTDNEKGIPEVPQQPAPQPELGPSPPSASDTTPTPFMELIKLDAVHATDEQIKGCVNRQVLLDVKTSGLLCKYTVVLLHADGSLTRGAANRIYTTVAKAERAKPILLILYSSGGDVSAAYLIAKLCQEHTDKTFEVAVPRRAKSAATLVCCGADKIHMGSLSELGPIDPQFSGLPALALKYSVEHIAQLCSKYPAASGMFSDYLAKSLSIQALGFFERVAESAVQYAVRLLRERVKAPDEKACDVIARRLVYAYKDHGFVIDSREAADIFGQDTIACNTDEYRLSNVVFDNLDFATWLCNKRFSRELSYIGDYTEGCMVWPKGE